MQFIKKNIKSNFNLLIMFDALYKINMNTLFHILWYVLNVMLKMNNNNNII